MFAIFKRPRVGNFVCIAAVRRLGKARRRINCLARQNTGRYLVDSQGVVFQGVSA
jgi:hypothetical protein